MKLLFPNPELAMHGLSHHQGNYFPRTSSRRGCEDRKSEVAHAFPVKGVGGNQ
jgi:hypothetical protein